MIARPAAGLTVATVGVIFLGALAMGGGAVPGVDGAGR